MMQIAAQLYTVRDLLAADFAGTLRKVHAAGYTHVELAGHGGHEAAALRRLLADCGLTACSDHCPIEQIETGLDPAIDAAHALGVDYLVCPYLPEERRRDAAGWLACARLLNDAGRRCRERKLQFCYHHHSFEFVELAGRTAFELLLDETDPQLVCIELDTYWIRHGGGDPARWMERLAGRAPLVHLKDMAADAAGSFAPVGTGLLDWRAILNAADRAGVAWAIVEQDVCACDPIDCLATSLQNLRRTLGRIANHFFK